ncbi:antirepressor AbbA [Massilibacterium senegalense]|uniref:antirepressor AbbA n=1 Tax=Massilibacterium senegalense TaxID=1632858 RepID=UPI0007815ACF|nr:antirepressor AbbA [Massilibacterium senegalense]
MEKLVTIPLSTKEQSLLLDVLFRQQYAKEVVSCEISDIESGFKTVDDVEMKDLHSLYIRLEKEGF